MGIGCCGIICGCITGPARDPKAGAVNGLACGAGRCSGAGEASSPPCSCLGPKGEGMRGVACASPSSASFPRRPPETLPCGRACTGATPVGCGKAYVRPSQSGWFIVVYQSNIVAPP